MNTIIVENQHFSFELMCIDYLMFYKQVSWRQYAKGRVMSNNRFSKNYATILLVDDNVGNLQLLSRILDIEGFHTHKIDRSLDVMLKAQELRPDLIFLDISMPDMNGFEVCKLLKSDPNTNSIPIIFITASNDVQSKRKSFQAGAAGFISKPYNIDDVIDKIHSIVI